MGYGPTSEACGKSKEKDPKLRRNEPENIFIYKVFTQKIFNFIQRRYLKCTTRKISIWTYEPVKGENPINY